MLFLNCSLWYFYILHDCSIRPQLTVKTHELVNFVIKLLLAGPRMSNEPNSDFVVLSSNSVFTLAKILYPKNLLKCLNPSKLVPVRVFLVKYFNFVSNVYSVSNIICAKVKSFPFCKFRLGLGLDKSLSSLC